MTIRVLQRRLLVPIVLGLLGASHAAAREPADPDTRARSLLDLGFENVTAPAGESAGVAYENRRYRHAAQALGLAHRALGAPVPVLERRFGRDVAWIVAADSGRDFRVTYPSDGDFAAAPVAPLLHSTRRRVDVEIGPLLDYRIGQLFNPLEINLDLQPRLRLYPWAGARLQLGVLLPLQHDYPPTQLAPDIGRVRPGRMSLEHYAWLPQTALVSVSAGYFGDNRWGLSLGAARPLAQGAWLLDAQIDRTGFLAFPETGTTYSTPHATSGFAGIQYRPGFSDVVLRARAGQYLYGDRGGEVEVRRSIGDVDVGYFALRSHGQTTVGIRLDLPVPPMERRHGRVLNVAPVPTFALDFRDRSEPFGTRLSGVASREDYLDQLQRPALRANAARYRAALDGGRPPAAPRADDWVSMSGMSGFIRTPWADVLPDRTFEAGYHHVPARWADDHRGTNDNQIFYATLGFLPRVEAAMRWTRIPGYRSFQEIVPDSRLVDVDRMTSGRVVLLKPRPGRPGLAAGIEDVQGTRRFHSSYLVAGLPLPYFSLGGRAAIGYGSRSFDASRRVLDGGFGAIELAPIRSVRVQCEYDSEKWNAGLGLSPGLGIRLRAVLLNMETLSLGAGWTHAL